MVDSPRPAHGEIGLKPEGGQDIDVAVEMVEPLAPKDDGRSHRY